MLANTTIPCAMSYLGFVHPAFLVPFLATQVKALQAVYLFKKEEASKPSAKRLKRT